VDRAKSVSRYLRCSPRHPNPDVLLDVVKKAPSAMALELRTLELVRGHRRYLMVLPSRSQACR